MKVLYFASLKETLKIAEEEIALKTNMTALELRNLLVRKYGARAFPDNIICAVNHEIVNSAMLLKDTDEVAFFPPVTGG